MYGYIYKTTNLVNGKIYIGKKVSKKFANYYKGSGKLIQAALSKYGQKNFICEMLEPCYTNEELNNREKYYIKLFNSQDKNIGYNISDGGDGGNVFSKLSPKQQKEVLLKMSNNLKGRVHITNEIIDKRVDKNHLADYLLKGFRLGMSNKNKSKLRHKHKILKKNSGWFKLGQPAWNKGIACTKDKKEKISNRLKGHKRLKQSNLKASKSMKLLYKSGYSSPTKGKIPWNKGKKFIWITNGIESHQIPLQNLSKYIEQGYHKGRIYKRFK